MKKKKEEEKLQTQTKTKSRASWNDEYRSQILYKEEPVSTTKKTTTTTKIYTKFSDIFPYHALFFI